MKHFISIKSNDDAEKQIRKIEINKKHLIEAINFREFKEVEGLSKMIAARAKALQMWNHGCVEGKATFQY